jgi:hypothetical protein
MADVCLKEYVRKEIKNRNGVRQLTPVGILYACVENGEILVGYAKQNRKLDKFYDKEEMVRIALERAHILAYRLRNMEVAEQGSTWFLAEPEPIEVTDYEEIHKARVFPYDIMDALPAFLVRCEKYFQQAKLTPWAAKIRAAMVA